MATITSIKSPTAGEIYNISDDEPAPINIIQEFGARILNANSLKEIPFEVSNLSDQTKFFWIFRNYLAGLAKGCLPDLNNT